MQRAGLSPALWTPTPANDALCLSLAVFSGCFVWAFLEEGGAVPALWTPTPANDVLCLSLAVRFF